LCQVEVKIDGLNENSEDVDVSSLAMEATLYDNTRWISCGANEGNMDMMPNAVAHMKLKPPPTWPLGFHGYQLEGKLDRPKLWSSEHVRNCHL